MNHTAPTLGPELLRNLTAEQVSAIAAQYGTPVYTYSEQLLRQQAKSALAFPAPYGLTVRYAMKANPLAGILSVFRTLGLHIDASSGPEVHRAIKSGFKPPPPKFTATRRDLASPLPDPSWR